MIKNFLFILLFSQSVFAQSDSQVWKEYNQGVDKTRNVSNLEQKKSLFNIDSSNQRVIVACRKEWGCEGGKNNWASNGKFKKNVRIKVASAISGTNKSFDGFVGNKKLFSSEIGDLWVTAVPEFYLFCKTIKNKKLLNLEIQKYLGLPPEGRKSRIVSLWVEPKDLFRPCLSPAIYTTSCPDRNPPNVDPAHVAWVDKIYQDTHDGKGVPTPFTKKGYTYYWGNPNGYEGASEYVVKKGAKLYVEKIQTFQEYCR